MALNGLLLVYFRGTIGLGSTVANEPNIRISTVSLLAPNIRDNVRSGGTRSNF